MSARERQRERCRANRQKNKLANNATKKIRRGYLRSKVSEIKESQPCSDCGFFYPAPIMEYDHRPGVKKVSPVARLVAEEASWGRIKKEMDKCDLVCANCHRYRTHISRKRIYTPTKKPPRGHSLTTNEG